MQGDDCQEQWVVASTRYNHEISLRDVFRTQDIEYFIPTHWEAHRFGQCVREIERPLIPNLIFIRAAWSEVFRIQQRWSNKLTFIRQKDKRIVVIADDEMQTFIRVLTEMQSKATLQQSICGIGDRVAIKSGPLAGIEGVLAEIEGKNCFIIHIGTMFSVSVRIPKSNLVRVRE